MNEAESPQPIEEQPAFVKFEHGNLAGLSVLLTKAFEDAALPGENYDEEVFASLQAEEIAGKVVFDVGGFMGINSLIFAKFVGPSGKVITFEPNPWNRERIQLNLDHNEDLAARIQVSPYALGDANSQIAMTVSMDLDHGYSSTSRLNAAHPKIHNEALPEGFFETDVEIRTLDWFVETSGIAPNVIKVDIEGAEDAFLRGGLKTLARSQPVLYIELHSEFCALQCSLLLWNLGYSINVLKEEADNRLMVKAVYNTAEAAEKRPPADQRLLVLLSNQNEITLQMQHALNREEARNHILESKHQGLQAQYGALQADFQSLQDERHALQADFQSLQDERNALQADFQSLKDERNALQADFQSLQDERNALQADFQSLQDERSALQSDRSALQADFQSLQNLHNALQDQHHALQAELDASRAERQALQNNIQTLQANHQSLATEYQALLRNYNDLINSKPVRYATMLKRVFKKLSR